MNQLQSLLIRWVAWFAKITEKLVVRLSFFIVRLNSLLREAVSRIPLTPIQWVVLAYLVIGVFYAAATPVFEAGEELEHYTVVHVLKNGGLPVQGTTDTFYWGDKASQPPLYYAFAALLTRSIDGSDYISLLQFNPYARVNDLITFGNRNLLLPVTAGVGESGTVLAVLVLRLVNVAFGACVLVCVHRTALLFNAKRPAIALLAAAVTAFNPMFVFVCASVSNLPLAMVFNGIVIACLMQTLRTGFALSRSIAVGAALAAAIMTHLAGLLILPVVLATWLFIARRDRNWRGCGVAMLAATVLPVAVCAFWFLRNQSLYGDPLGFGVWLEVIGRRAIPIDVGTLFAEMAYFRQSFWGIFGVGNLKLGEGLYFLLDVFVFISLFGLVYMVMQLYAIRDFGHARRELSGALPLLGIMLLGIMAYFVLVVSVAHVPGTVVFPLMGAISPMLAAGFIEVVWWFLFFITPPDRSYVRAGDAVPNESLHPNAVWSARFLAMVALLVPLVTILPTYRPPAPIEQLEPGVQRVYARYDGIELVGYQLMQDRYLPGQVVGVTLYWRVLEPTTNDYTLSLALLAPGGEVLGKEVTYPGWGTLRTSAWQAGAIYADTYFIRLDPLIVGNLPLRLHVSWWDDTRGIRIAQFDEKGDEIPDVLLRAGAMIFEQNLRSSLASLQHIDPRKREFGAKLRLEQFSFDRQTLQTVLIWDTMSPMLIDYTMTVQILNPSNEVVSQFDTQPPLPTSFWGYGDRYFTIHPLVPAELDPGDYRVIVAVYDLETMERLTVFDDPDSDDDATDYVQLFSFSIGADGSFLSEELNKLQPESTREATPEATEDGTIRPQAVPVPGG
jgi:hypothetical protein